MNAQVDEVERDLLVETLKVLPLREGDVLVFRSPRAISAAQAVKVKEFLEGSLAKVGADKRIEVIVMDAGCDLEVIRPSKLPVWRRAWEWIAGS